jgi:hypothetical protein
MVRSLSPAAQRHLAIRVAAKAIRAVGDETASNLADELEHGAPLQQGLHGRLLAHAEGMDDLYLDLLGQAEDGRASHDVVSAAFRRARAASALACAGTPDPLEAVSEAIVEAAAALGDPNQDYRGAISLLLREANDIAAG